MLRPAGAVIVISSRPSAANVDNLKPRGFRFFQAMPLRAQDIADALGNSSQMAEYVETPLALSLAKRAQKLGESPETSAALYASAIDKLVADAGGGGAEASSHAPRSKASTCAHC